MVEYKSSDDVAKKVDFILQDVIYRESTLFTMDVRHLSANSKELIKDAYNNKLTKKQKKVINFIYQKEFDRCYLFLQNMILNNNFNSLNTENVQNFHTENSGFQIEKRDGVNKLAKFKMDVFQIM